MCGIAGVMTSNGGPPDQAVLEAMAKALAHRGPDGTGHYRAGDTAMVHRRLAVIDLVTGDQPIMIKNGPALIANAEIYNYRELAADLGNTPLATRSDCEPPLHCYRRYGLDFVDSLRGMYAIAIHDPAADRLVLARDPFGIKPLYFLERPDLFAFASEPQALIAAGLIAPAVAKDALGELLQLQYAGGRQSLFAGIERVLPGELLVISHGRIVERHRRAALPEGPPERASLGQALARLDQALENSVHAHQQADVPFGMFLSGGIDSSALLVLMARLNSRPVRAYTAGFRAAGVADERAQARAVAQAVGAEAVEVEIDSAQFWRRLPEIAAAVDDACADYAVVPTYLLAERAAKEVKVILSGEGGDEMLAGYGRYRAALRPWWRGGRAMRARGVFDRLNVLRELPPAWRDSVATAAVNATAPGRSRLQILQASDCVDWLPNDLLVKLDRCLMAHGLEGRTPFLDVELAKTLFRLPDDMKLSGDVGKWLLRQWLDQRLPVARAFERKRGFTVPVAEWIAERGVRLGPLIEAQPAIRAICRPGRVAPLYRARGKHAGFAGWTLLFYALWHRRHILGLAPAGDVFETLAATPRD